MEKEPNQTNELETNPNQKDGSAGPLIGSIIIILIVIAGGVYFFSNTRVNTSSQEYSQDETYRDEDVSQIEADLESQSYADFETEFAELEAEFEAAIEE